MEGRRGPRKDRPESSRRDTIVCYECKKPGHVKNDCPLLNRKKNSKPRKSFKATWSDDSDNEESESDFEQVANICLMAWDEQPCLMATDNEVSDSDSDEHLSYDELYDMCEKLDKQLVVSRNKRLELKKNIDELAKKLNEIQAQRDRLLDTCDELEDKCACLEKEKNVALEMHDKIQKDMSKPSTSGTCSCESLTIENDMLKRKVEDLTSTLAKFTQGRDNLDALLGKQRCVFEKSGLGFNPAKHQKYYKNFFVKASTSTHIDKNTNGITKCNFCGRQGHYAHICRLRRIAGNVKLIWVPKGTVANSQGPKKKWVPKINVNVACM